MPKQLRLRRGTTPQHATFTGADGEVTFDTTKKCLVLHDGVTAGGRPLEGWLVLAPGNPLLTQEVKSALHITGGNPDTPALSVTHPVTVNELTANGAVEVHRLAIQQETLIYAATVNLDFRGFGAKRLDLAGNLTLTTSNIGIGRELLVRIVADGSARTLAFPAGWRFVGGAAPASIGANKTALLRLWCFGLSEDEVVAQWLVEI